MVRVRKVNNKRRFSRAAANRGRARRRREQLEVELGERPKPTGECFYYDDILSGHDVEARRQSKF